MPYSRHPQLLFSKCQIRIVEHLEVPNRPVGTNLKLVRRVRGKNFLSMKAERAKRVERLTAWGPGARSRAPGRGPGGGVPGSSWVLAVFRWKRMGLRACFDTVFNYFNIQILHFTMVKNIKLNYYYYYYYLLSLPRVARNQLTAVLNRGPALLQYIQS